MLQHEHFTLFGGQVLQRRRERLRALGLLQLSIGAPRRCERLVRQLQRSLHASPASPLGETAVPQNQEQPPRKLVRLAAVRQMIERPHQSVLRSEEHTSELQSRLHLVCRLLLEKKNNKFEE